MNIQLCNSYLPFHVMLVPSRSKPGYIRHITVPLPGDARAEWYCDCEGWTHRGTCAHLAMVNPCYWAEDEGPEKQTDQQRRDHQCPRCNGTTFDFDD